MRKRKLPPATRIGTRRTRHLKKGLSLFQVGTRRKRKDATHKESVTMLTSG